MIALKTVHHASIAFYRRSHVGNIHLVISTMAYVHARQDLAVMTVFHQCVALWQGEQIGQCDKEITVNVMTDGQV